MESINCQHFQGIYLNNLDDPQTAIYAFLFDRETRNLSPGTLKFYRQKIQVFLNYLQSNHVNSIGEITPDLLRSFLKYLRDSNHNAGGLHAYFRTLRAFFLFLESENDGYISPLRKVKSPSLPQIVQSGISVSDIHKIINACRGKGFTAIRDKALLLFLYDTGLRISECLNLRNEDIDLIRNSAFILRGKGSKSRYVFFGKNTHRALKEYQKIKPASESFWLTKHYHPLSYDTFRAILNYRAKLAGIPKPPSAHDFRRAFALNMLRNGCDLITLQRLLGHSNLSVLHRYLAQNPDDLRIANNRYSPVDRSF